MTTGATGRTAAAARPAATEPMTFADIVNAAHDGGMPLPVLRRRFHLHRSEVEDMLPETFEVGSY